MSISLSLSLCQLRLGGLSLLLAFQFSVLMAQVPRTLYVSPQGNDAGTGTLTKPFRTLAQAQQTVRQLNRTPGDVVVYLRGGEHPLEQTLLFTARDGGQGTGQVMYRAYAGEQPVLTGGKRITGWVPDRNGIVKAPAKGLNFRQLYVNDRRAIRARQPDAGEYYRLTGWDLKGRNLIIRASYVRPWKNFSQVEAVLQTFWAENYVHLKSSETFSGGAELAYVSIRDQEADILFPRPNPQKQADAPFHFENAYEFVTQPGEWYLDTVADTLYYLPEKGQSVQNLEVVAPATETLLRVAGTLDEPVRNLQFEGLTFTHSNWTLPSIEGVMNAQAGLFNRTAKLNNDQTIRRPAAAVAVANASEIVFEKNRFQHLGSTAIDLESGTNTCRIIGNVIRNIAGNGILVGAFVQGPDVPFHLPYNPTDRREICTDDQVSNNYITRIGQDYYGTCGVTAGYTAGLKIEHNVIRNAPYTGISIGYGWTDQPNALRDNRIAFNEISHVMTLLCDGGAIYTLSLQPGTHITENYIHDIKRSSWSGAWPIAGIYLDQASGGTLEKPMVIERNVVFISDPLVRPFNLNMAGNAQFDSNRASEPRVANKAGIQEQYRTFVYTVLGETPQPNSASK